MVKKLQSYIIALLYLVSYNSNVNLDGIEYSATVNIGDNQSIANTLSAKILKGVRSFLALFTSVTKTPFIDGLSASRCSAIAANSYCELLIQTPVLNKSDGQGSALISVNYQQDGKKNSSSRLVNFALVDPLSESGVVAASGATIYNYAGKASYATLYYYGSGKNNIYKVNNLSSDKAAVSIIHGNPIDSEIASGSVNAVEVMSDSLSSALSAKISLASTSSDGDKYLNSSSVGVMPIDNTALLVASSAPILNTEVSTKGSFFVANYGNKPASITSVSPSGGVVVTTNSCTGELAAGSSCTIGFTVPVESSSPNSGSITLTYAGGSVNSLKKSINWYNHGGAVLSMQSSSDPIIFSAANPETGSFVITIGNFGSFPITLNSPTQSVLTGSALIAMDSTVPDKPCKNGLVLRANEYCSINYKISSNVVTSGQVQFGISGVYNTDKIYNRKLVVAYSGGKFAPALSVSEITIPPVMGDGIKLESATLTISNNGDTDAILMTPIDSIVGNTESRVKVTTAAGDTNSCGKTLPKGKSCNRKIIVSPPSTPKEILGSAQYSIKYYGGSIPVSTPAELSKAFNYTVTPNQQDIKMLTAENTGSTDSPARSCYSSDPKTKCNFSGASDLGTFKLTYVNNGSQTIKITGVDDSANSANYAWQMLSTGENLCSIGSLLPPGDKCMVIYKPQLLAQNAGLLTQSVIPTDITVPSFIFTGSDGSLFKIQPQLPGDAGITLWNSYNIATITNSVTNDNAGFFTVASVLANNSAYPSSDISVVAKMENYFLLSPPPVLSPNCTIDNKSIGGIMQQTCKLSSAALTGSVVYGLDPAYAESDSITLHVLYNNLENKFPVYGVSSRYFVIDAKTK